MATGQQNSKPRLTLLPEDRVQLSSIVVQGAQRTQTSLVYRYLQETAIPVSLLEQKGDEKPIEKAPVVISPNTCLRCVQPPVDAITKVENQKKNQPSPCAGVLKVMSLGKLHPALTQVTDRLQQLQLFEAVDTNLVLDEYDREKQLYHVSNWFLFRSCM